MEQGNSGLAQILSLAEQTEEPEDPSVLSKDIARYLMDPKTHLTNRLNMDAAKPPHSFYQIYRREGYVELMVAFYDVNNKGIDDPDPKSTLNIELGVKGAKMIVDCTEHGLTGQVHRFATVPERLPMEKDSYDMTDQQKYELVLRQAHAYLIGR